MKRARILIGFADALAAPEAAWSLLDAGFEVYAFARAGRRPTLARCHNVNVIEVTPPEDNEMAAVSDLHALSGTLGIDAAMPLDDFAIWLCDKSFRATATTVVGPLADQARLALDKREQLAVAGAAGFSCPPTIHVERPSDVSGYDHFPVVVKPALAVEHVNGRLRKGTNSICSRPAELSIAVAQVDGDSPRLLQPLIRGTGEGVFGLSGHRGVVAWSAHRRIRMMNPAGSGSSACVTASVDPELLGPVEGFLAAAAWRGPFMVELLRDASGVPWFVEFNGRLWGSLALARRAGLEYPAWAIRQAFDPDCQPSPPAVTTGLVCRHLGRELAHVLFVLRGPQTEALASTWPTRREAIGGVLRLRRGERWYNYRRDNLSVFLADTAQTLTGLLGRASRGRRSN